MLPVIGTLATLNAAGRLGVVLDVRPVAEPESGRQLVALKLKTIDQRDAQGQAAARISGLGPLPVEGGEPAAPVRARPTVKDMRAAGIARLPGRLSAAEQEVLAQLRQRDGAVRQEETTHAALAGDLAGPISYVYHRGPDGRQYAVGGSVGIQATTRSGDPAELERLGARIRAAATAPTNPSAQDYATARLGLRLYAEGQSRGSEGARIDLTS